MNYTYFPTNLILFVFINSLINCINGQAAHEVANIFQSCHKKSPEFDGCIKNGFNELRRYFKTGIILIYNLNLK